jgi:hypothetical protein
MKRFTHCEKWEDPWFRKLPPPYKCLWQFICDKCDAAGVWKVDLETASYFVGVTLTGPEALKWLDGRIRPLRSGYWLVSKFVDFQFGKLSSVSPPHIAVLKLIRSHTLTIGYPKGKTTLQDKDKEKDKDKDKEKAVGNFGLLWEKYPAKDGRKDAERHFNASVKNAQDWLDIQKALANYLGHLKIETWKNPKNGSTWFNNWRDWINYKQAPNPLVAPSLPAFKEVIPPPEEIYDPSEKVSP